MLIPLFVLSGLLLLCAAHFLQLWLRFSKEEALKPFLFLFPALRKKILHSGKAERFRRHLSGFTYFEKLNEKDQAVFLGRVAEFMSDKRFEGKTIVVSEEMQVRISACAVQLLFGMEEYYMPFLDTIIVYDGYIRNARGTFEALAMKNGNILISWQAFNAGYANASDCINTGLYVFAEALQMGVELFPGDDPMLEEKFSSWQKQSDTTFNRLLEKPGSPLSGSAQAGRRSFFATCIEHFFEAPEKLKAMHPDLYQYLSALLRQDPLDPQKQFNDQPQRAFEKSWRRSRQLAYLHVIAIVLAVVGGIPGIYFLMSRMAFPTFLGFVMPAGLFLLYIIRKLFKPSGERLLTRLGLAGNAAVCVLITAGMLSANALIPVGEEFSETYAVVHREVVHSVSTYRGGTRHHYTVTYTLENDAYAFCTMMREYYGSAPTPDQPYIRFFFRRGIFGIKTLKATDWLNQNRNFYSGEQESLSY